MFRLKHKTKIQVKGIVLDSLKMKIIIDVFITHITINHTILSKLLLPFSLLLQRGLTQMTPIIFLNIH